MALLYSPPEAENVNKEGVAHAATPEEKEAAKKELEAVTAASKENYVEAHSILTAVIEGLPEYASAYNNRYLKKNGEV